MTEAQRGALAYLDANVFIDFVDGEPEIAEKARDLLQSFRGRTGVFATSELTLAEVLAPQKRRVAGLATLRKRKYLDLIVWNRSITLIPVDRYVLYETAELRRHANCKLPDAIHIATAILTRCRFLISRDIDMKKLPKGALARLDPGPSTIAALIGALDGH